MKVLDKDIVKDIKTVEMKQPVGSFWAHAEIKNINSEKRLIEGFASTKAIDRQDDIVEPSAFEPSLPEFRQNAILLGFHDHKNPIGKVNHIEVTDNGLFIKAQISKTEDVLWTKIQEGILKALSIGFRITDRHMETIDGKEIMRITGLKLFEISVVSVPANQEALFNIAKAAYKGTDIVCKDAKCKRKIVIDITKDEIELACNELRNELEPQIIKAHKTNDQLKQFNNQLQSQLAKYQADKLNDFNNKLKEANERLTSK